MNALLQLGYTLLPFTSMNKYYVRYGTLRSGETSVQSCREFAAC
jgi:hypothetical protein